MMDDLWKSRVWLLGYQTYEMEMHDRVTIQHDSSVVCIHVILAMSCLIT